MKIRSQIQNEARWWDLPAALILLIILTTAFTRLMATEWTDHLIITRSIAYLGMIAGLALGYSLFRPRWAIFFALLYGAFFITWRVGLTLGEDILWQERLQSIGGRVWVILSHLAQQKPVPDNLLFLILMGIVFWILSVHAGYSLSRHGNPWAVIIPTGVALILIHSYDSYLGSRGWYLILYLFFALLFVARMVYANHRKRWDRTKTYVPPYLGLDFIRYTLVASVLLVLLSWTIPALADTLPAAEDAWQRVKQPWNEVRNTLDNAFASLRSTIGIVSDYYGSSLPLGRGNPLSDSVLFLVATPPEPPDGARFYWRARIYDTYENGWSSNLQSTEAISPEDFDLVLPDREDDAEGEYTFSFSLASPISTLFAPNQPVWLSRPAKVEYTPNPDGSADLTSIQATPYLRAGEIYHVRSSLNEVTIAGLRNAGNNYPEWVTDRYLQLPNNITPRTRNLATEIASGKENVYDIAEAITNYLRSNMEYSPTVPALPTDQELVDWFLFDLQQGFCNYYATAEVVMLRSLGIPARLAVGYAQGEIQQNTDTYLVRQSDAHAWPEVYFPGFGWVEFEPTASQPLLVRPVGEIVDPNLDRARDLPTNERDFVPEREDPRGEEEGAGAVDLNNTTTIIVSILISLGVLLIIILLMVMILRRNKAYQRLYVIPISLEKGFLRMGIQPPSFLKRWANHAGLDPLSRSYMEINYALYRLGEQPSLTDTPKERATALVTVLPVADIPTHTLISEYHRVTYSPQKEGNISAAEEAGGQIRWLSYKSLLANFLERFREKPEEYQKKSVR